MAVEGYTSKNVDPSMNSWDKIFAVLPQDMKQEFLAMNKDEQELLKMTIMSDMRNINNMSAGQMEEELWKQTLEQMTPEAREEYDNMDEEVQEYHKFMFFVDLQEAMENEMTKKDK